MKWHRRFTNSLGLLSLIYGLSAVHARITAADCRLSTISISHSNSETWNLTEKPDLNDTTSNFIFETANSLLQHWPNTRYRNGHTLVPVTIPTGTLLYHGTLKTGIPQVPEWLALDPEHSYFFCGVSGFPPGSRCWLITFVTTRPLKLLYFDGSSAAKMSEGPLDSQDLLVWGRIRETMVYEERQRIDKLCAWGKNHKLDGFVRMETDFEVMLCNFTTGIDLVTFLNLHMSEPPVSRWPDPSSPAAASPHIRMLEAGGWSDRFPGDQRIKVDYSRLISFYDKTLFPNLHQQRVGQERWDHRLKGINKSEVDALFVKLNKVFTEQERESVIDWKELLHVVTNRYADRLELLRYLLENATIASEADQEAALWKAHRFVSDMLMPYTLQDSVPPENLTRKDHNWAAPVFKYCATTHIRYLETLPLTNLTESERVLLSAVRGVSKEICRVLVVIWAEGKELSTKTGRPEDSKLVAQHPDEGILGSSRRDLLVGWKTSVSDLMAWLDWSVWVRCQPMCRHEEMCYLPTWPYLLRMTEGWKRPQPICIPRLEPYDL